MMKNKYHLCLSITIVEPILYLVLYVKKKKLDGCRVLSQLSSNERMLFYYFLPNTEKIFLKSLII